MRILFTGLVTSTVLLLLFLDNPDSFRRGALVSQQWLTSTLHTKDVRVEGLHALSRTEVERVLPLDRSVLWWLINMPVVQARVADNPWIGKVTVESCGDTPFSEWGCFIVSVVERQPRYAALVDNEVWIVSDDGTFLIPSTGLVRGQVDIDSLIHVTGLASRSASPDIVRAQLALAKGALETLERRVPRRVKTIEFGSKGDIVIGFDSLAFPVVFSSSPEAGVSLDEQGVRCEKLLSELNGRLEEVERIDLAFQRVGIVKFKPPPKQAPSPKGEGGGNTFRR